MATELLLVTPPIRPSRIMNELKKQIRQVEMLIKEVNNNNNLNLVQRLPTPAVLCHLRVAYCLMNCGAKIDKVKHRTTRFRYLEEAPLDRRFLFWSTGPIHVQNHITHLLFHSSCLPPQQRQIPLFCTAGHFSLPILLFPRLSPQGCGTRTLLTSQNSIRDLLDARDRLAGCDELDDVGEG